MYSLTFLVAITDPFRDYDATVFKTVNRSLVPGQISSKTRVLLTRNSFRTRAVTSGMITARMQARLRQADLPAPRTVATPNGIGRTQRKLTPNFGNSRTGYAQVIFSSRPNVARRAQPSPKHRALRRQTDHTERAVACRVSGLYHVGFWGAYPVFPLNRAPSVCMVFKLSPRQHLIVVTLTPVGTSCLPPFTLDSYLVIDVRTPSPAYCR
jgi:hypothetical protein